VIELLFYGRAHRILFNVISVAFVLLLLTTVSGGLFSEEIFGRPLTLNHKTVFSLVATKGTAGAAVQCMNIALGLDEAAGLTVNGVAP